MRNYKKRFTLSDDKRVLVQVIETLMSPSIPYQINGGHSVPMFATHIYLDVSKRRAENGHKPVSYQAVLNALHRLVHMGLAIGHDWEHRGYEPMFKSVQWPDLIDARLKEFGYKPRKFRKVSGIQQPRFSVVNE